MRNRETNREYRSKTEYRADQGLVNGVEAARVLGITHKAFSGLRCRGTFDLEPVDNIWLGHPCWRREDVLAWLEARPARRGPPPSVAAH